MGKLTNAYEILTGPVEVFFAPVGSSAPALTDLVVGAPFTALGETEEGVTIAFGQNIEEHRTAERTGVIKASRTEETPVASLSLVVATLENMELLFGTGVTSVAAGEATIGTKALGLYRGREVLEYAFILRGKSAYGDFPAQYFFPRAYIGGEPELGYTKEGKVTLETEIHVLEDLSAVTADMRHGSLTMQTAPVTT